MGYRSNFLLTAKPMTEDLYQRISDELKQYVPVSYTHLVEIRYPYTTMLGVLKRIGITKKMSYEVADLFAGQSGVSSGCNAYQLYLAMSDVIFLAQCEGASAYRIAQLEENIARALRINWHEYDRPGDFKW